MGVPAFYRWLSEKYPKIVSEVLEERTAVTETGEHLPPDCSLPPPTDLHTDNLYIDMNGIIHPCSHPENGAQPRTEGEMYDNVTKYVDRLFAAVRPRRLLYLAVDGVAPRAKMNQQRARRFRSAQEARDQALTEEEVREGLREMGRPVPPKKAGAWDSNVITPGTPFMLGLSEHIRHYVRHKLGSDPAWKGIKVLYSDASVPGEGEHKIIDHIRRQRGCPGYDPNIVHCLHGLDADLIMLALATHEAHFYITREEVLFGRRGAEQAAQRREASGFTTMQRALDEQAGPGAMEFLENKHKPLQRLSVPVLREYLAAEFNVLQTSLPFKWDFERVLDDIVFMAFFVGNDFLPHLPSLDIRDGALDFLFNVYKRILPGLGDYLTAPGGVVNLRCVGNVLAEVGTIEDYVFNMRHDNEGQMNRRRDQHKGRNDPNNRPNQHTRFPNGGQQAGRAARVLQGEKGNKPANRTVTPAARRGSKVGDDVALGKRGIGEVIKVSTAESNNDAAKRLKSMIAGGTGKGTPAEEEVAEPTTENGDADAASKGEEENPQGDDEKDAADSGNTTDENEFEPGIGVTEPETKPEPVKEPTPEEIAEAETLLKEKLKDASRAKLDKHAEEVVDNVRLHDPGWRDRYYNDKCKTEDIEGGGGREKLFQEYVVGLAWVMRYYYGGVASWKWYFPFHYAPFASDLRDVERFAPDCATFDLASPFSPVEQLMSVLPEDSNHAVPEATRWLMGDKESPILDFYPKDVPCDPNGKAMPWLWVVLLPFIDEERLLAAMESTREKWTKKEHLCNARGLDDGYIFVNRSNLLASSLSYSIMTDERKSLGDASLWSGFTGLVRVPLKSDRLELDAKVNPPPTSTLDVIYKNKSVCAAFTEPPIQVHKSEMLPGATPPPAVLLPEDRYIKKPRLNRGGKTIAFLGTQPFTGTNTNQGNGQHDGGGGRG
eukprot:CAMPEP_0194271350 /NCGR_PEP_ID=MMETSP0169-20130528/5156_1 /TAXON_ID=218684 /ORGANISM="Corethron pennatum, Strain L29A3" /LENGTH=941 /DNA_ID=CAMNT_0039013677 /DNA_START=263 /DNA_END=3084 /DNA_ORIENTATION=+